MCVVREGRIRRESRQTDSLAGSMRISSQVNFPRVCVTSCVTWNLRDLFVHTCEPAVKMTDVHPQASPQIQSATISKEGQRFFSALFFLL